MNINTRRTAKRNRRVDVCQLSEVSKVIRDLRKAGITPSEYDLISPFSQRPRQHDIKPEDDPRAHRISRYR